MLKDTIFKTLAASISASFKSARATENKQLAKDFVVQNDYYAAETPTPEQTAAIRIAASDASAVFEANKDLLTIKRALYLPDGYTVPVDNNPVVTVPVAVNALGQTLTPLSQTVRSAVGTEFITLFRRSLSALSSVSGDVAIVDFIQWVGRIAFCALPPEAGGSPEQGIKLFKVDFSASMLNAIKTSKSTLVQGWSDYYGTQAEYYDTVINHSEIDAAELTAQFQKSSDDFLNMIAESPVFIPIFQNLYPSEEFLQSIQGAAAPVPLANVVKTLRTIEVTYGTLTRDPDGKAFITAFRDGFYALGDKQYVVDFADVTKVRGNIGFCVYPN